MPGIPGVPVGGRGRIIALGSAIPSPAAWHRDAVSSAGVPPDLQTGGYGPFPSVQLLLLLAVM